MAIDPELNQQLHKKLPIDADENVLAIYKHHWFAYVSTWLITILVVLGILGLTWLLTSGDNSLAAYRTTIMAIVGLIGFIILVAGSIPAYLRSQEQLVLTDESLLKLLKPTIFSNKVDQVGLQHVADVAVTQDVLGTMFGYGKLTIETPGEQRTSYDFYMVPNPTQAAQQISEMKENFDAALQGGRIASAMPNQMPQAPQIDPQEYQEFLQFQQMRRMQQGQSSPTSGSPQQGQQTPSNDQNTGQNGQNQ
jgi:uncharacterized membrane protein YdbT with pleckstrin-like domain